MGTGGNYTHCGDHFIMYRNMKSLLYTLKLILDIISASIKK